MKQIDKTKFNKRKKGMYRVGLTYNGETNGMNFCIERNGKPLMEKDVTDEDLIIVQQLIMSLESTIYRAMKKRDLIPDEIKTMPFPTPKGEC